jgi:hypothetical protein
MENKMLNLKRDLPIYALSASLVFVGVTISTNQASAAVAAARASDLARLQAQFTQFKNCANSNFSTIGWFDANRNPRMNFIATCY